MKFLSLLFRSKETQFKSLEDALKQCRDAPLSQQRREAMKRQIMASLKSQKDFSYEAGLSSLVEKIKNLASQIVPAAVFRSRLRERLTAVAAFRARRFSFPPLWISHHRRAFASVIAAIFVFGVFFQYTFNVRTVEASFFTTLQEVSGEVTVMRDERVLRGEAHLLLKADDVIRTGPGSKAVIRFLDQSVSRLDENTEVKISRLFMNPLNKTETVVELVLHRGRLWSRVINLIDNLSRFQVKAKNTVAVAKKRAAFDISVTAKGKAKVSALQNGVDLMVATDKKVIETTLVKGFTAEVKTDAPLAPQIHPEQAEQKDTWVADNLAQDKTYIESVKQENQDQLRDQIQMLPGNPFYAMKEISEGTKIALTLDDFERQKKLLAAAREKFAEAQGLLLRAETEKAQALLAGFQSQIQDLLDWVKTHEAGNPAEALALQAQIKEVLNAYEKQFVLLLPQDPLYRLKESVAATQLIAATNIQQKTQELAAQAGDKLLEAHDLVEQGNTKQAKEQVEAYSKALSDAVSRVQQLPSDEKEQAVSVLLDNKAEDLKALETIAAVGTTTVAGTSTAAKTAPPQEPLTLAEAKAQTADLKKTLTEAKNEALVKLGEAVLDVQKTEPSSEVLKKLEDIKKIEVNGKAVLNVTLTRDRMYIQSNGAMISVTGSTTPPAASPSSAVSDSPMRPAAGSESPESPPAQP